METNDLFRKLKPIMGRKADALWLAHATASTPGERQEIEIALNILASRHLNSDYEEHRVLLPPPPRSAAEGPYAVGKVVYNDKEKYPFGLRDSEWIQHVGIFGRSGAGKTNLALNIIKSLLQHKKPFLIFDWKRNYRDLLTLFPKEKFLIFTVGRDISPIQFNPLIPPPGTRPDTWLKKLIEVIATTYYVGEGVISLLLKAMDSVYETAGVYKGHPEQWPTMKDVLRWLEEYPAKGREQNWLASTFRAIKALCFGEIGRVVNVSRQFPVSSLLRENVILELDSLTNSDKTFFIESLLLWIHHYRMAEAGREEFKHVIMIEEAHHILTQQEKSKHEGITDIILREIRELGESIVLLDQLPSLITTTALANTHCTFTFNLKNKSCVFTAAKYTLIGREEQEYFGRLPVGQAIVKLQGRWFQPFLLQVPHIAIRKGSVSDQDIARAMEVFSIDSSFTHSSFPETGSIPASPTSEREESSDTTLSETESAFLQDILDDPLSGVSRRYARMGLSRRRGTEIKESLRNKGYLEEVSIPLASGRIVLAKPTDKVVALISRQVLKKGDLQACNSLEHEFWKKRVRQYYEKAGHKVMMEFAVKSGFVDLVAQEGGDRVAIEVETGNSDIGSNIRKVFAAGFSKFVLVPTNEAAVRKVDRVMAELPPCQAGRITVMEWKRFS